MKIRYIIGIIIIFCVALYFPGDGLIGSQDPGIGQDPIIENTIPAETAQNSLNPVEQIEQDEPIYSKTTIIPLVMVVMGIVAFRRNRYS